MFPSLKKSRTRKKESSGFGSVLKVQENQVGSNLNRKHAEVVNISGMFDLLTIEVWQVTEKVITKHN